MTRGWRRVSRLIGILLALVLLVFVVLMAVLPTPWFHNKVRDRVIAEVERVTGGRAEIGQFRFDWKTLTVEISPFVLHGTEPLSEKPLVAADSIKVGLKIVSFLKRDVDIALLDVAAPHLNVIVDAKGETNFPAPKIKRHPSGKDPVEQLLKLAVAKINVRDGWLRYGDRKLPLVLQGEDFVARLAYDLRGPAYRGELSMTKLLVDWGKLGPLSFGFDSRIGWYKDRIQIESAHLGLPDSAIDVSGSMINYKDPVLNLDVKADTALKDVGEALKLPRPHVGRVHFEGKFAYDSRERLLLAGRMHGTKLAVHQGSIRVDNIAVDSDVRVTLEKAELRNARVHALGGVFRGMVDIVGTKTYKVNGRVEGISLAAVSRVAGVERTPYGGSVSGPIQLTGTIGARDLQAGGRFEITPAKDGVPANGTIELAYKQATNSLELGESALQLPSTKVTATGTLGDNLHVRLDTQDLKDLNPALDMAGIDPKNLPVALQSGGSALFEGTVSGPVKSANVNGVLTVTNFRVQQQTIDRLVANLTATPSNVHVSSFALGQQSLKLEGSADADLQNWKLVDAAQIKADVKLQGAQVEKLLAAAGQDAAIKGVMAATATLTGTASDPRAAIRLAIEKPTLYGQQFDRIRAEVKYAGTGVEIINGVGEMGTARVLLAGSYQHPATDWKNGKLVFDLSTQNFSLDRLASVKDLKQNVKANFEFRARGSASVRKGDVQPDQLDGVLALRNLVVDDRPVGNFVVDAKTAGGNLAVAVTGNLRGSRVTGNGSFQLSGDYPGSGNVDISPIRISTVQDFFAATRKGDPLPIEGTIAGNLTFSGPIKKPEQVRARMELPTVEIVPARQTMTGAQAQEFAFKNDGPILLEYDGKSILVRAAHIKGRETDFRASGTISPREKNPWDLKVDGKLNLGILQDFSSDIVSSGAANVQANIRGSMQDPQVVGRMELQNASFYITDMPNGLDNANGVISFDRRRATIDRLTAETGGGSISLGGFIGFGSPEISYRLQARADNVRIRYPEGVSTTISTNLSLTGTSSKSLLAGVVTVRRAGFNPKTDVGGILAGAARPVAAPITPNPFLRGMQLDIHIESAPNLTFQTTLTSDLQAEADLRLRGTAAKPALLGRILVNQGQVQFFGNKYTINRGEIGFYNPTKLEPTLDMDLETTARGVQVTINCTGTLSKLNVSYRSDPPLQSNEIVALLAVGRAPGTNSSLASGQTVASQSFLSTGTNTLLGQAVTAPISGRLQRFFGVSKLKIDPQLTGINAVPQARLTVEQQVSRDVTLTYITNLAQGNQQIVRLQWDMSKSWSVVALREENGAFGVDFFFKKRLK